MLRAFFIVSSYFLVPGPGGGGGDGDDDGGSGSGVGPEALVSNFSKFPSISSVFKVKRLKNILG